MKVITKLVNKRTNEVFVDPNPHLVAYAKGNPDFESVTEEVPGEEKEKPFSYDMLKVMSMKDLQTIADSVEAKCDKRSKDALIDAILKAGR